MRPLTVLLLTALLAPVVTACSTKGDIPPSKHIEQKGPLKVHPELLGQPGAASPADGKQ